MDLLRGITELIRKVMGRCKRRPLHCFSLTLEQLMQSLSRRTSVSGDSSLYQREPF